MKKPDPITLRQFERFLQQEIDELKRDRYAPGDLIEAEIKTLARVKVLLRQAGHKPTSIIQTRFMEAIGCDPDGNPIDAVYPYDRHGRIQYEDSEPEPEPRREPQHNDHDYAPQVEPTLQVAGVAPLPPVEAAPHELAEMYNTPELSDRRYS